MNCNTTHYRANSSSVPGDPTLLLGVYLLLATGRQSLGQVRKAAKICDDLDKLSHVRWITRWVLPPAAFVATFFGVSALVTIPSLLLAPNLVDGYVEARVGVALKQFLVDAIVEYAFRLGFVVLALYAQG